MNLRDPEELAQHGMENENPRFVEDTKKGEIIVAGTNFGCGSSREHVPLSIKGKGISCVIAKTFARIFYRSALNTGLPVLESDEAVDGIQDGHEVEVGLKKMERASENANYSEMSRLHYEFHMTIYRASKNEELVRIIDELWRKPVELEFLV